MSISPNTIAIKPLFAILTAVSAVGLFTTPAHAEPTGYNQLSFGTEVKQEVDNDEVTASLYKKTQAKDAKTLANELNTAINQALVIAKRYPSVTVSSGQQNTYPRYDDNDKIIGWKGQAYINLKSSDFTATSELIAGLQNLLVMDNLNFGVSEAKQDAIEKQLMLKASQSFQTQANSLAQAWNADGYRVVSVNLNAGNRYIPRPMMGYAKMEMASDATAPNFEAGNSTVTVTANGTIELVK